MALQAAPRGPSTAYTARDARLSRFQDALAKLSTEPDQVEELPAGSVSPEGDGWVVNGDGPDASSDFKVVKSEGIGPLLGGFADIEPRRRD